MEIKEGKFYRTRDGHVVGPIQLWLRDREYPWIGTVKGEDRAPSFTEDGHYYGSGEHAWDLIEEVPDPNVQPKEPPMPLKIEEGKFYRNRRGEIVGPMEPPLYGIKYPWTGAMKDGTSCLTFTDDGHYDMNKEHAFDLIEEVPDPEIAEQIAELEAKLADLRKQQSAEEEWPKLGEHVWFLGGCGHIYQATWANNSLDNEALSIGNVFRTREEAEAELDRRKTLAILRKHAQGFVPDFGHGHCRIFVNLETGEARVYEYSEATCVVSVGTVVFPSVTSAQAALDEAGEDAIRRLMGLTISGDGK
jgi:hypothetical protein